MSQIEVTSIAVKIGAKRLELTPSEAKELRDILDDLLGHKIIVESTPHWVYKQPIYQKPYTTWNVNTQTPGQFLITNTNYSRGSEVKNV